MKAITTILFVRGLIALAVLGTVPGLIISGKEVRAQSNDKIVTWTPTGSTAQERRQHTATKLPDGRVLIVGDASNSTEIYDPGTELFSPGPDTIVAHGGRSTATRLPDDRILIVGGRGAPTSAEIYDPAAGIFQKVGSSAAQRTLHTATLLKNGKVLIAGGFQPSPRGTHAIAELFDPATETFTPTGNLNQHRADHTATLLENGQVLIAGGAATTESQFNVLSSAELYDPVTESFLPTGSMSRPRLINTATLLPSQNGKVLILGGAEESFIATAAAEIYDPVTGLFSSIDNMISRRVEHTATLLVTGEVLIAGGADALAPNTIDEAELYDPVSGTFTTPSTMVTPRQEHTATLLSDGRALIVGGFSVGGDTNMAELAELIGPSLTPTGDSFLQSARRTSNEGGNQYLVLETFGRKRPVVRFDLSAETRTISQATLILTLARPTNKWRISREMVDVHRLLESFVEGNGSVWGQPSELRERGTGAGVTWNCVRDENIANRIPDCDDQWNGGSDAADTVTDSVEITNRQTGIVAWDVTVDVQAAQNSGDAEIQWLIKKARERLSGEAVFYSKEGAAELGDMAKAPRLELEFQ